MGLVAVISRNPRISLTEWQRCIQDAEGLLVASPERSFVNPFTGLPAVFRPQPEQVRLTIDGSSVGAIEPSPEFDDDGELLVYGPKDTGELFREAVSTVARRLDAAVEWLQGA